GTVVRLLCTNPSRSSIADTSGGPDGGLISALTAVSSMPLTTGVTVIVPPLSQLVRLVVPNRVAPVPYIIRLALNGSMDSASVIQPSLGLGTGGAAAVLNVSHGSDVASSV